MQFAPNYPKSWLKLKWWPIFFCPYYKQLKAPCKFRNSWRSQANSCMKTTLIGSNLNGLNNRACQLWHYPRGSRSIKHVRVIWYLAKTRAHWGEFESFFGDPPPVTLHVFSMPAACIYIYGPWDLQILRPYQYQQTTKANKRISWYAPSLSTQQWQVKKLFKWNPIFWNDPLFTLDKLVGPFHQSICKNMRMSKCCSHLPHAFWRVNTTKICVFCHHFARDM